MNNQSGPDGCTEQTSGLDLLVGPPRAHSVRMGASYARARGALHAQVYSIQIRHPAQDVVLPKFWTGRTTLAYVKRYPCFWSNFLELKSRNSSKKQPNWGSFSLYYEIPKTF